jgi:hypothetical protein
VPVQVRRDPERPDVWLLRRSAIPMASKPAQPGPPPRRPAAAAPPAGRPGPRHYRPDTDVEPTAAPTPAGRWRRCCVSTAAVALGAGAGLAAAVLIATFIMWPAGPGLWLGVKAAFVSLLFVLVAAGAVAACHAADHDPHWLRRLRPSRAMLFTVGRFLRRFAGVLAGFSAAGLLFAVFFMLGR